MYYITGKIETDISSDDSNGDLQKYFEMGYEYGITHLYVKHLYASGISNKNDTIVTIPDRKFFYTGLFDNVIGYKDFLNLNIDKNNITDLCEHATAQNDIIMPKIDLITKKYEFYENEKDIIHNIDYVNINKFPINSKYIVIHVRKRKWADYRNLPEELWKKIIIFLLNAYRLPIFVFGNGSENLCDNKHVFYVNLDEYASLMHNSNCLFFLGSLSGGTLISQSCLHNKAKSFVMIVPGSENQYGIQNILFHHEIFNFSGAKTRCFLPHFYNLRESKVVFDVKKIYETIIKGLI